MTDRAHIFTAMQALLDRDSSREGLCAVLVVRMRGMREAQLRFGYGFGNEVMLAARERIVEIVRHIDKVFVAADDTFVLLLPAIRNRTHALLAATRLVGGFDEPLMCGDRPWHGRVVVGAAMHPEHGAAAELLCRRAEIAHDEALRIGEPFAMYQPDNTQVEILYGELREDIEANRLQVYFQPLLDLRKQTITRVESLARWNTQTHGEVAPVDFIPFAERSDLIVPLTRWSLNASLRHVATLHRAGAPIDIAINLSARVFVEQGFAEQMLGALDIWGVPAESVIVEVTETALLTDLDMSVRVLRRLRDRGMRVAIDDFGTGYASFAYLRHFPATELKIDRTFVDAMIDDPRTEQLVRAMVEVAHRLGLEAVAEGVENQETLDRLIEMNCDMVQGFHVGRPSPADEFVARQLADASFV
ncbi:EAL domain-containing protein (putative c-di-GMP-specific phosphodiesterase class I) [Luteibacter rhizovicinus]|uniref:EAL domain-containing protein (Putative c-di-GMP-specific phosphodiesterase class I) n=1 Tax=Luteibacter rhizovicinus TaxID=242606 RepID=A0A4R3YH64_9GAMM|nr:bifunctional diguanylate cyclase/phosphodiesterase [Luteibacter rhizovicinus]TCV91322.1 EAL domain-containing protein (putative c-di-GMP-specific phosphodiesterase class I) [Luteibacter rhizovicinus]